MRQRLLLALPVAALLASPEPAAAQAPYACAMNTMPPFQMLPLNVRIHSLGANGQDLSPASWQRLLPAMEACRPLQGASAVRFEVTSDSVVPGSVQVMLCSVTVNSPGSRVMLVISGDGGSPQCNIR